MGKAFEKQIKTIEDQVKKQVEALKGLEPKSKLTKEIFPKGYKGIEVKNKMGRIHEYRKKNQQKKYDLLFKQRTIWL